MTTITTGATVRFQNRLNRLVYLANAMLDQHIGAEEIDDGVCTIHFNTVRRGLLQSRATALKSRLRQSGGAFSRRIVGGVAIAGSPATEIVPCPLPSPGIR